MGIIHRAAMKFLDAARIGKRLVERQELSGDDDAPGGDRALEEVTAAHIAENRGEGDGGMLGHDLMLPSRPRESRHGCADSSRSGKYCRTWCRRSRCPRGWPGAPGGRPPA